MATVHALVTELDHDVSPQDEGDETAAGVLVVTAEEFDDLVARALAVAFAD
jgi:hypothetical protein